MALITSPGKFEGEQEYMLLAYDLWLEGWAEYLDEYEDDDRIQVSVDQDMREKYPELGDREYITFYISSDGFVIEVDDNND